MPQELAFGLGLGRTDGGKACGLGLGRTDRGRAYDLGMGRTDGGKVYGLWLGRTESPADTMHGTQNISRVNVARRAVVVFFVGAARLQNNIEHCWNTRAGTSQE